MRRLFTFGCSFTNYCWPTWADFLSLSYDKYYNYGQSGGGNRFIFEQICEADIMHEFTEEDKIVIMWSSHHRHDLYKNNAWHTYGNIFNAKELYDREYIDKYFDIKGAVMHSLHYIHATKLMLHDRTNYTMASMLDMVNIIGELHTTVFHKFKTRTIFTEFPDLKKYEQVFKGHWVNPPLGKFIGQYDKDAFFYVIHNSEANPQYDNHPTPQMHLDWCSSNFQINNKEADKLLSSWHDKFNTGPIHKKNSSMWCKENIRYEKR